MPHFPPKTVVNSYILISICYSLRFSQILTCVEFFFFPLSTPKKKRILPEKSVDQARLSLLTYFTVSENPP